jgi:hypothetical protein
MTVIDMEKVRTKKGRTVCVVKGCSRKIRVKKHKLCQAHYKRLQRFGTPGETKPIKRVRSLPAYAGA